MERLRILLVSQMPPSPPGCGAQARMHGLASQLGRRHELRAVVLLDPSFDRAKCAEAMRAYCEEAVFVHNPKGRDGSFKRALQLRSLASLRSYEHHRFDVAALQPAVDELLARFACDLVLVEFPFLARYRFRTRDGRDLPRVIDTHNVEFDLQRQMAQGELGLSRRLYGAMNWRKLRAEEIAAFRSANGLAACSAEDERRLHELAPGVRTVVVPNAADVDFYQPRSDDPTPDGRTILFFGLLSTFPNVDGVGHFLRETWPRIAAARPHVRLKIVGGQAPRSILEHAGPRVEIPGFAADLRPHLASAAAVVVPLRIGGGTRLKIVEAMAMGRPIVSTAIGAEGIDATHGRDILIADEPAAFADAVVRLIDDPELGGRIGRAARQLAAARYSWASAADNLERFFHRVLDPDAVTKEAHPLRASGARA